MSRPFGIVTKHGKFVPENVLARYSIKEDEKSRQLVAKGQGKNLVEPLYNPNTLAQVLELNTYHYRCCRVKALDIAGLDWKLEGIVEEPDEGERRLLEDFFDNLPEPPTSLFKKVMFDFEAIGYGAIELVRENYSHDGQPALLNHIPAHTLRIHTDQNRFCQIRGNKKRWFRRVGYEMDVNLDTGAEAEAGTLSEEKRGTEVIFLTNYTPRSDYYGMPDIVPGLGAIHGDVSRRNYNIAFFDNYGVPAYAVFVTGNFEDEEILDGAGEPTGQTYLEREIEEHFRELAKNPHSTLILSVPTKDRTGEVKIDFKPLSTDVKEASFRLYRKDNRDEVLVAHGVPGYRIGITEAGSLGGDVARETTEIYKRSVIEPRQEQIESLINKHILWEGFEVEGWRFKFADIDTEDEAHDYKILRGLFEMGAVTPNQLIRHFGDKYGLETVDHPAMDLHYLGMQTPLDSDEYFLPAEEVSKSLKSLQDTIARKVIGDGARHR